MSQRLEIKEGWATVILLLVMFFCVVWSIQMAEWTQGLAILQWVVLVGGVLSIVLAKSHIPNRMAHLLSALAGLTWSAYLTGRVVAEVTGLSVEMAVVELDRRVGEWISALFSGESTAGSFVFLLLLALLLWIMSYFCAWAVFRWQRVWWAVIVCGLALMLNLTYAPLNLTGFLVFFLLAALLLVVRASLASYEEEWKMAGVGYSPDLVYGFLRAGLTISVAAILLAWGAPRALASRPLQQFWEKAGEPWRRLQDQYARVFQDLNYRNEPAFVSFSRVRKFGGPVRLSDEPVMDVRSGQGRYWRVVVFHDYTGDGWLNTDTDILLVEENERTLAVPDSMLRQTVTQTVTLRQELGPEGTIAAAAQPVRLSLPLRAVVSLLPPAQDSQGAARPRSLLPVLSEPSVLYSRRALKAGDSYQAVSALTVADEESLRQAGTDYPGWVVPRYLQLPDSLPPRIRVLAEQITAGHTTPYDKALAIEHYLRDIPYNELITGPKAGQDGVEYFLFEARQGYCQYYASAMVVMLRAVGIPARYVEGYSQTLKEGGVYHILKRDSHAWPEVFFPGYGWIEFEPTAGEPALVRPRAPTPPAEEEDDELKRPRPWRTPSVRMDEAFEEPPSSATPVPEPFLSRLGRWAGLLLTGAAAILAAAAGLMIRRYRRIQGLSVAERVYGDLEDWVRRLLRIQPLAHQTPHEYTAVVADLVPQGRSAIERIADLYVRERFGGKMVPGEEAEAAWSEVWPALWRRGLRRIGERLRERWVRG